MRLAIVGIFFDGYHDLWEDFLAIFRENWPDCPYPLYIVDQEKNLDFEKDYGVKVLHAGTDAEYSRKVQKAVEEIDADYYLLMLEDFFIGDKLEKDHLEKVIEFIEDNDAKYYGFSMNLYGEETDYSFCPSAMTSKNEYTIVSGNNIIRREFLEKCIGISNYNAWVFEGIYAKSKEAHSSEFLNGCYKDKHNYLHIYHGVKQGKFLPHTYKHFSDMGYTFHTKREILSSKDTQSARRKAALKGMIPDKVLPLAKTILRQKGVLDRYSDEIRIEMGKMGLE